MTNEELWGVAKLLFTYLAPTLQLFGATLLFSLPLGMVAALLKMWKFKPVSWLMSLYILVMRGTPLMLQIIAIYYAIPYLKVNENLPGFIKILIAPVDIKSEHYMFCAVVVAFTLNYTAYFAEIFRGGIESIPKGQYEAAACLGMTKTQTFMHIVLPQVVKRVVPASANEVITLVKDTSLANSIAYAEITLKAKQQMQLYSSLAPLFLAGLFYLVMTMVLTALFALIEKKLGYYK